MQSLINKIWGLLFSSILLCFLSSCSQDEEEMITPTTPKQEEETPLLNSWIYEVMSDYYFWNEEVTPPNVIP